MYNKYEVENKLKKMKEETEDLVTHVVENTVVDMEGATEVGVFREAYIVDGCLNIRRELDNMFTVLGKEDEEIREDCREEGLTVSELTKMISLKNLKMLGGRM